MDLVGYFDVFNTIPRLTLTVIAPLLFALSAYSWRMLVQYAGLACNTGVKLPKFRTYVAVAFLAALACTLEFLVALFSSSAACSGFGSNVFAIYIPCVLIVAWLISGIPEYVSLYKKQRR